MAAEPGDFPVVHPGIKLIDMFRTIVCSQLGNEADMNQIKYV